MNSERRASTRHYLEIPVRFRCFEVACGDVEITTRAVNISRSGIFMPSPRRLALRSELLMTLRVPTEISGSVFAELQCTGRVVHERAMEDGTMGYGVEIERMAPGRHRLEEAGHLAARV